MPANLPTPEPRATSQAREIDRLRKGKLCLEHHPANSGDHATGNIAREIVGNFHSKSDLVQVVTVLLRLAIPKPVLAEGERADLIANLERLKAWCRDQDGLATIWLHIDEAIDAICALPEGDWLAKNADRLSDDETKRASDALNLVVPLSVSSIWEASERRTIIRAMLVYGDMVAGITNTARDAEIAALTAAPAGAAASEMQSAIDASAPPAPAGDGQADNQFDDGDPCQGGAHCCCCGPGEPCCDCGQIMPALLEPARKALQAAWTDFLDANPDEVTSPEEWPDHALVTCDQMIGMVQSVVASLTPAPAAEDGWRDIASAPKDGTRVDLWWFSAQNNQWLRTPNAYWNGRNWQMGQFNEEQHAFRPKITHWMPLPAPPTPTTEEAAEGEGK